MQQHRRADADREALDRRNDRLLRGRDRLEEIDGDARALAGRRSHGEILDVVAAGEGAAGTGQQDGAD